MGMKRESEKDDVMELLLPGRKRRGHRKVQACSFHRADKGPSGQIDLGKFGSFRCSATKCDAFHRYLPS